MKTIGVYQILNTENNHKYIGSSANIESRIRVHKSKLNRGIHSNGHLQRAWDKYGESNFSFSIIEKCAIAELCSTEQHYINSLKPEYNILRVAYSARGYAHTEMAKEKIGIASKLNWENEEYRNVQSENRIGHKYYPREYTLQQRLELSQKMAGNAFGKGSKHTEKWKKEASDRMIGNQYAKGNKLPMDEESRMKRAAARKKSWETRRKNNAHAGNSI